VEAIDQAYDTSGFAPETAFANGNSTPVVTAAPADQTVSVGGQATFTAAAFAVPAPTVVWQVSTDGGTTWTPLIDDNRYSGTQSTTLTINNPSVSLSGAEYEAVFSNSVGSATTAPATLTVTPATPTVTVTAAGGAFEGASLGVAAVSVTGVNGQTLADLGDPSLSYTYYAGTFTSAGQLANQSPLPGAPAALGAYTVVAQFTDATWTGADPQDYTDAASAPTPFSITEVPSLVVNTTADVANAYDGLTSLRDAIIYADTLTTDPTITFDPTVFGTAQTITLDGTQLPTISQSMTIVGPGAGLLTIDAQHKSQMLTTNQVVISMSGLTLADGQAVTGSAGISNSGTLALTDCVFMNNATSASGGALASTAKGSSATLTDCTFTGNSAGIKGGAIVASSAMLTLTDCTLTGNSAGTSGGAVLAGGATGQTTLTNCTVVGNFSSAGVGGLDNSGTITLTNTIIAGNTNSNSASDLVIRSGTVSGSYNLIGTGGAGGLQDGVTGNQVGVTNPLLGTLGYYGGDTLTVPLLPGSPAIDTGSTGIKVNGSTLQAPTTRPSRPSMFACKPAMITSRWPMASPSAWSSPAVTATTTSRSATPTIAWSPATATMSCKSATAATRS
jgi:predicted outer membrane repeat protein